MLRGGASSTAGGGLTHALLTRSRTNRTAHLFEYTIRYGASPSVEGRRLVRQETDARNWEFPQVSWSWSVVLGALVGTLIERPFPNAPLPSRRTRG